MADIPYAPTTFFKGGQSEVARDWDEHFQYIWDGWSPIEGAPDLGYLLSTLTRAELIDFREEVKLSGFKDALATFFGDRLDVTDLSGKVLEAFAEPAVGSALQDIVVSQAEGPGPVRTALARSFVEVVTPEQFGAVGNGVADDTAAVVAAFNAANTKRAVGIGGNIWHPGATVALRPGATYYLPSLSDPILVSCNVQGAGATLHTALGYSKSVLLVGHETGGHCLHTARLDLPNLEGTATTALATGSIGVTFQNLYASDVRAGRTTFFETGHRWTGKGSMGSAYNNVRPGWTDFCKIGWRFDSGSDGTGWANQNTFTAGEIAQSPVFDHVRRAPGWKHIVMDGGIGGWSVHANTFVGCSFEGNLSEYFFWLRNAADNQWIGSTRFEQGDAGRTVLMGADLLASPDAGIYINSHGLSVGDLVCFTGATLVSPLVEGTAYYVKTVAADHFTVATTPGGSTVTFNPGNSDVKLLRPPTIYIDNTAQNTFGNKVQEGYSAWPGPIELVKVGPQGPSARPGIGL